MCEVSVLFDLIHQKYSTICPVDKTPARERERERGYIDKPCVCHMGVLMRTVSQEKIAQEGNKKTCDDQRICQ